MLTRLGYFISIVVLVGPYPISSLLLDPRERNASQSRHPFPREGDDQPSLAGNAKKTNLSLSNMPFSALAVCHRTRTILHFSKQSNGRATPAAARGAMAKFSAPIRAVIWPLYRLVTYVQRAIFRFVIRILAGFLTALLIDPGVNHAAASAIKDGMNMWFTQPNVKAKLIKLQENLAESEDSLAKPIGEDFPKLLFNFISGLILQGFDASIQQEKDAESP